VPEKSRGYWVFKDQLSNLSFKRNRRRKQLASVADNALRQHPWKIFLGTQAKILEEVLKIGSGEIGAEGKNFWRISLENA